MPLKELQNPKKHNSKKTLAYVAIYKKTTFEVFKKKKELKNSDKIKEIWDTTEVIKNQRQPKHLQKNTHLFYIHETHNTRSY